MGNYNSNEEESVGELSAFPSRNYTGGIKSGGLVRSDGGGRVERCQGAIMGERK
jgi:hypothetical protein